MKFSSIAIIGATVSAQASADIQEPKTMFTDAQAAKWNNVSEKIQTAAKLDIDLVNQINGDMVEYIQDTKAATKEYIEEAGEWNIEAAKVNEGFKNAIIYNAENVHYDAPRPGHPGSIDFTNSAQVNQKWRDVVQADQNLGQEIIADDNSYNAKIAPAQAALQKSTNTTWKTKAIAYNNAVKAVIAEIKTPAATQMQIEGSTTLVTDAQAAKWTRVANKIQIAAKKNIEIQNQEFADITKYFQATQAAQAQLNKEAQQWVVDYKVVGEKIKAAWAFGKENVHYDAPRPGHPGSIEFTQNAQVVQKWRDAVQYDHDLEQQIIADEKSYIAKIAPAQAAFKKSYETNWVQKSKAYVYAIKDIITEIKTPAVAQMQIEGSTSLVTDAQAAKMRRISDKIQTASKLDLVYINAVQADVQQYMEATADARAQYVKESKGWLQEGALIDEKFVAAWESTVSNTHFDAPRLGHPGSIDFTNQTQVVNQWRDAVQTDQNVGQEVINDVNTYKTAIAPAQAALMKKVPTWQSKENAFVQSVKAIVQEIKTPIPASAVSMMAHPVETIGNENLLIAAGCLVVLAVATTAAVKKNKKTIEFEVDQEMAPRKESKKMIKKTLANIMKKSDAKATLIK